MSWNDKRYSSEHFKNKVKIEELKDKLENIKQREQIKKLSGQVTEKKFHPLLSVLKGMYGSSSVSTKTGSRKKGKATFQRPMNPFMPFG